MKQLSISLFILIMVSLSCNPLGTPRDIDWQKEWNKNKVKLKALAEDIVKEGNNKYKRGINDFPEDFDYPFDDGFGIKSPYQPAGADSIDSKCLTITFYVDRGLLDHYSAIIFTNDSSNIWDFDRNVANGGNDFKIEPGWYMIND